MIRFNLELNECVPHSATPGDIDMGPILASILLIVEAVIALGMLLAIPVAIGYGAFSARQRRETRG